MHFKGLLEKVFSHRSIGIDKRVHRVVLIASKTLCECKYLSIAGLGRELSTKANVKHAIKRIDRLFGNARLHSHREQYYRVMTQLLVGANPRPVILVDWSGLTRCGEYHFLRASVPVGGRALVIWESTHRESEYMTQKVHRQFIRTLRSMLPDECRPILVTDAGFRMPWFKLITRQGWDVVGRVRQRTFFRAQGSAQWLPVNSLYDGATHTARCLFKGLLAKANPLEGYFYLYRDKVKNRKRKNLRGKKIQSSASLKHAKRGREPWLLFSSMPDTQCSAKRIVGIYRMRMQIEEAFRDLKNTRNGFSLRHCRSFSAARLNIALLISALAMFALWLLGVIAKRANQHRSYQANSVRHRNVLSTFTIGWQSLKRKMRYRRTQVDDALTLIQIHASCGFAS